MPPRTDTLLSHLHRLVAPAPTDAELLHRWVTQREEAAFAALVTRHGRMVHGVCRRIVGNDHDADDTFQAVFLVLARKADTLRHPEALAAWLHGVALRLAAKARSKAARRIGTHAVPERCDPHPDPLEVLSGRELLALIDEEIARLPEVYRLPVLLCDVEQRTQPEAARLLGWTLGSLRGRLLRGRAQLRERLLRRGIAPSALVAVLSVGQSQATAEIAANVSQWAVLFSTSSQTPAIPPAVAALARIGLRSALAAKLKLLSALVLTVGLMTAGAGLAARHIFTMFASEQPADDKPSSPSATPRAENKPRARVDQAGDPLPDEAIARLGTSRFRHTGLMVGLAFTPDGKKLVCASMDDGIRIWDAASGERNHHFRDAVWGRHPLALSSDSKQVAILERSGPERTGILLRELSTGRLVRRFGERQLNTSILFGSDGKTLAAFGGTAEMDLWDASTGGLLRTLKGHKKPIWAAAFAPDGKTLATGGVEKTIRFWDVATGKPSRSIDGLSCGIRNLAFSPDGKFLASIGLIERVDQTGTAYLADERVRLWELAKGKEVRQFVLRPRADRRWRTLAALAFTPDGKTMVTGSNDGSLCLWDIATCQEKQTFADHARSGELFALAPDGKTVAVEDSPAAIHSIDLNSGKDRVPLEGHRDQINSIGFSRDCQTIVTTAADGTIRSWEATTGREQNHRKIMCKLLLPCNRGLGGRIALVFEDGVPTLHLQNADSDKKLAVLTGYDGRSLIALSTDQKTLAVVRDNDHTVELLDLGDKNQSRILTRQARPIQGLAFLPNNRTLVLWTETRTVEIWDVVASKKLRHFAGPPVARGPFGPYSETHAVLSPDGKLLAFGVFGSPVCVFDTEHGKEVRRFQAAADCLAFSPDSKTLAWNSSRESIIHLGEIVSGRERHRFVGDEGIVGMLSFSPDGRFLVSAGDNTTALVWDLTGRLGANRIRDKPLSVDALKRHWDALAAEDAAACYRAIQALAADPERSLPYLRARLQPIAIADETLLKRLIADLEREQFTVRDNATTELEKLGEPALHALRKAFENRPSLEMRRRLEQLIEKQEREEWKPSPEGRRQRRTLEVLERIDTAEARRVLATLAEGAPGARLTLDAKAALERLKQRENR